MAWLQWSNSRGVRLYYRDTDLLNSWRLAFPWIYHCGDLEGDYLTNHATIPNLCFTAMEFLWWCPGADGIGYGEYIWIVMDSGRRNTCRAIPCWTKWLAWCFCKEFLLSSHYKGAFLSWTIALLDVSDGDIFPWVSITSILMGTSKPTASSQQLPVLTSYCNFICLYTNKDGEIKQCASTLKWPFGSLTDKIPRSPFLF
jgi:hypothetical protein